MAEFRWIIMSSFVMLLFSFREAAGKSSSVTVRVGDEATLPCENVKHDQNKCDKVAWKFSNFNITELRLTLRITLFEDGQIHKDAATKSDRLNVTEQCSLVIKNVTVEDAGYYTCTKIKSGQVEHVDLSVVSITEQKNTDTVSLLCSVTWCGHTVKLLHEGIDVTERKTSQRFCSARVIFITSDFNQKSKNDLLKCEVTNKVTGEVQVFPFNPPQSSGEKPATTTPSTRKTPVKKRETEETNRPASENNNDGTKTGEAAVGECKNVQEYLEYSASVRLSTVRVGDEATLSCENVKHDQDKCDKVTWKFTDSSIPVTVMLIEDGQIHEDAATKSDRLNVTEQCSLVIKNVTEEDAGSYTCTKIGSGQYDHVELSVLSITEQKNTDTVSLLCSVTGCLHTVKWLHEGSYTTERKTSGPICSARATFTTSDFNQKSKDDSLKCEVRHAGEVHLFPFSPPQSSATTTPSTRKTPVKKRETEETNRPASENNNDGTKTGGWWLWLIGVFVAAAALLIISVAVLRWKRTKENKTQTDDNMARVDDEGEGDEDDAVTYSTLQASSSAAADPSNLYATVN